MERYTRCTESLCRVYTPDRALEASALVCGRPDLKGYSLWGFTPEGWQLLGYVVSSTRDVAVKAARGEFLFMNQILVILMDRDELSLLSAIKSSTPVRALCLPFSLMNSLIHTPAQALRERVREVSHE